MISVKDLKWELADILREFGDDYRRAYRMPFSHHKVMHAVIDPQVLSMD